MIEKSNKNAETEVGVLVAAAKNKNTGRKKLLLVTAFVSAVVLIAVLFIIYTDISVIPEYAERPNTLPNKTQRHKPSEKLSLFEEYENILKPKLTKIALSVNSNQTENTYAGDAQRLISWFKDELAHSQQNDGLIEPLSVKKKLLEAEELINSVEKLLSSHFQRIESAFWEKNYAEAIKYLESVESLAPVDERVIEWKEKLNNNRKLFSKYELLREAIAANDINSQLKALEEIEALGKLNEEQNKRKIFLKEFFKNQEYNKIIGEAGALKDLGYFEEALVEIQKARALTGDTASTQDLESEVTVRRDIKLSKQWKTKALASTRIDDWESGLLYFNNAQRLNSTDEEIIEGINLSKKIIESTKQLTILREDPIRLTDPEVESFARTILVESSEIRDKSKRLSAIYEDVRILIDTTLRPRSLLIESDGKTRIEIKGVGFIEPTLERTIDLKPGYYLLYGSCVGHKTKITELEIPLRGSIEPKRITCGKRIY
tara:strand:- start:4866 stop:6332 length:1467 start_codon:yes stop_codon:yes gene_type:complete